MTNHSQNDANDDQVLARLYKEGAKETASAKLNYEIINHAAKAEKSSGVSSHFGGGWKVPLSLAASVVVVFGLIVQLDQNPKQLKLPPIPDISAPSDSQQSKSGKDENRILNQAEEITVDDISSFNKKLDFDASNEVPIDESVSKGALSSKEREAEPAAKKKTQPTQTISRDLLESEPGLEKPVGDMENLQDKATESLMRQRSTQSEKPRSEKNADTTEDMASESGRLSNGVLTTKSKQERESEFAPIPVEDWLLMIEKLVARKDYAEAARQLQKFKQAHPKVNVEDLESKIP